MSEKSFIPKWYFLVACIALSLLAGFIGTLVTITGPDSWFAVDLIKPVFEPPAWIFAPVWTVLYILMGTALALILNEGWQKKEVKVATAVFAAQLILNILWSYIFFGWHMLTAAAVEIIILWLVIAVMLYLFYRIRKAAGYLIIPYILWVTFATVLTITIAVIN